MGHILSASSLCRVTIRPCCACRRILPAIGPAPDANSTRAEIGRSALVLNQKLTWAHAFGEYIRFSSNSLFERCISLARNIPRLSRVSSAQFLRNVHKAREPALFGDTRSNSKEFLLSFVGLVAFDLAQRGFSRRAGCLSSFRDFSHISS
jgi:hypothetical protein